MSIGKHVLVGPMLDGTTKVKTITVFSVFRHSIMWQSNSGFCFVTSRFLTQFI